MTLHQMRSDFWLWVTDVNQREISNQSFTPALVTKFLNRAQDKVVGHLITNHATDLINELHASDTDEDVGSSGEFLLTGLTYTPFANYRGIVMVKINGDSGRPCRRISFAQYRRLKESTPSFSIIAPIYYQRGSYIYIEPYDSDPNIDIYYIKAPATMNGNIASGSIVENTVYYVRETGGTYTVTYDSTAYTNGQTFTGTSETDYTTSGNGFVEVHCELDDMIADVISQFAAAEGFYYGAREDRALMVEKRAYKRLDEIIEQFSDSESVEYGDFIHGDTDWTKYPYSGGGSGTIYNPV